MRLLPTMHSWRSDRSNLLGRSVNLEVENVPRTKKFGFGSLHDISRAHVNHDILQIRPFSRSEDISSFIIRLL